MHIDKYKQPDGTYLDDKGSSYQDAETFLQDKYLNHCYCGNPDINIKYVADVLAHIDSRDTFKSKTRYDEWIAAGNHLYPNDTIRNFVWYVMDSLRFTEHGGCIPGWLTDKGREFMEDVKELYA
jgi:hypothetical protein